MQEDTDTKNEQITSRSAFRYVLRETAPLIVVLLAVGFCFSGPVWSWINATCIDPFVSPERQVVINRSARFIASRLWFFSLAAAPLFVWLSARNPGSWVSRHTAAQDILFIWVLLLVFTVEMTWLF